MNQLENNISKEKIEELVKKLRGTVSVSKRKMLDEAADTIETLYSIFENSQKKN